MNINQIDLGNWNQLFKCIAKGRNEKKRNKNKQSSKQTPIIFRKIHYQSAAEHRENTHLQTQLWAFCKNFRCRAVLSLFLSLRSVSPNSPLSTGGLSHLLSTNARCKGLRLSDSQRVLIDAQLIGASRTCRCALISIYRHIRKKIIPLALYLYVYYIQTLYITN